MEAVRWQAGEICMQLPKLTVNRRTETAPLCAYPTQCSKSSEVKQFHLWAAANGSNACHYFCKSCQLLQPQLMHTNGFWSVFSLTHLHTHPNYCTSGSLFTQQTRPGSSSLPQGQPVVRIQTPTQMGTGRHSYQLWHSDWLGLGDRIILCIFNFLFKTVALKGIGFCCTLLAA